MSKDWMEIITLVVAIIAAGATVWAAIATYLAAKSARDSADISAQQFRNQVEEQKRIERPRLVPLNQLVLPNPISVLSDWRLPEIDSGLATSESLKMSDFENINFPYRFSKVGIPIINAGKSFAIDIVYTLELVGGIDSIKEFKAFFAELSLELPKNLKTNPTTFNIHVTDIGEEDEEDYSTETYLVTPHKRHISLIESNNKNIILVPNYFVVLCNIYFTEFNTRYIAEEPIELNKPKMHLTITYQDQYTNQHSDKYLMELSTKQFDNLSYHSRFEAWIDFKHINSSSISNIQKSPHL